MANPSKSRGTRAETEVVKYLREWWPTAERRALSGKDDRGDVAGIPGLVVEVKAAATQRLAEWKRETLTEQGNADAKDALLVVKRPHKPVAEWDAYLPWGENGTGVRWVRCDLQLAVEILHSLRWGPS